MMKNREGGATAIGVGPAGNGSSQATAAMQLSANSAITALRSISIPAPMRQFRLKAQPKVHADRKSPSV